MVRAECASARCDVTTLCDSAAPLDDTWALVNGGWQQVTTGTAAPTPRVYHSAVQDPTSDTYLVYGGTAVSAGFLSDLWRLRRSAPNTGTWEEVKVSTGVTPPPRAGHSALVVGTSMVVFGGRNSVNLLQDGWVLDLHILAWTEQRASATCSSSTCPSVRTNHAAALTTIGALQRTFPLACVTPRHALHRWTPVHGNSWWQ